MDDSATDRLAGARWWCSAVDPGGFDPGAPAGAAGHARPDDWFPAAVPGTVAGAWIDSGRDPGALDVDGRDWWYRTEFEGGPGLHTLIVEGLATVGEAWINGRLVGAGTNMFRPWAVEVDGLADRNELLVRVAALTPLLAARRPRPRWKSMMVEPQSLRWFRTTVLGRQPGWSATPPPAGLWRPVRLVAGRPVRPVRRRVVATPEGDGGRVEVELVLAGDVGAAAGPVPLSVGAQRGVAEATTGPEGLTVRGRVDLPRVERWWPHSHGGQPLYPVALELDGRPFGLGRVGFRDLRLERDAGAFTVVVNDVAVFCRGACWWPIDPVRLACGPDRLDEALGLVRAAGANMLRVPGGTIYEDERFWDRCDELGILVWQDAMLGYVDPPDDEAFAAEVAAEVREQLGRLGGRPAAAVVCGGQQIEEQAAFFGLPRERWEFPIIERTVPEAVADVLPGLPYVTSSPTGGDLPFRVDIGDSHYWGVGSLLRPPEDARRSRVRFMSEGMAFAVPPERQTVDECCGGAARAGHDPAWKLAVHHDTGRSWDLEDVRDHYVNEVFGVDPHVTRYRDPERALDLGRAVVAELVERTFSEWRRPASPCDGGLLVAWQDLVPGAGWGIVDALGRPKAPYYALARRSAPVALLLTDEGINGLCLTAVNDTAGTVRGALRLELHGPAGGVLESVTNPIEIPARGATVMETTTILDGFRDVGYAYRYGPPAYDVVVADLLDDAGGILSGVVHLNGGPDRPVEPEVGLAATARPGPEGTWELEIATERLAQWVVVEVPGFRPADSWFHLPPGRRRVVALAPTPDARPDATPRGQVRALNAMAAARVAVAGG